MNADDLAKLVLQRTHDSLVEAACTFFRQQRQLEDIRPSQVYALKNVSDESTDWPSLEQNLRKFLKHQQQRDERVDTTGWKELAPALKKTLEGLGETLRQDLDDVLKQAAQKLKAVYPAIACEVEDFLAESTPQEAREQRMEQFRFHLARNFVTCLYRLHRGREVLGLPLAGGKLYSQGGCHVYL